MEENRAFGLTNYFSRSVYTVLNWRIGCLIIWFQQSSYSMFASTFYTLSRIKHPLQRHFGSSPLGRYKLSGCWCRKTSGLTSNTIFERLFSSVVFHLNRRKKDAWCGILHSEDQCEDCLIMKTRSPIRSMYLLPRVYMSAEAGLNFQSHNAQRQQHQRH